jgi:mannose-1-phosphate guanylyltransferase/mannose-6-phosphate isomerase
MPDRHVLVLAGGRGERFWPWSRPERPKQLLPLARDGRTLLAATFERARRIASPDHILVMTAADLVADVRRQCPGAVVLGEPLPRNTAPAIAAACAWFPADAAFAVMPADHAIDDTDAFARDLERAFARAEREPVLVTFGVRATRPEVNFGYIRRGARLEDGVFRVAAFREKPDRARAEAWAADGDHLWNAGIFVWRGSVFMEALEAGRPVLARAFRGFAFDGTLAGFEARLRETLPSVEAISVDYAVMERATNTVVFEAAFDWDDLGSWGAWARRQPRDARGNVRYGATEVQDCDDCVVVGEGGIAAAIGLRDMVVVHAHGATLACPLDRSEHVRRVSEAVRARGGG